MPDNQNTASDIKSEINALEKMVGKLVAKDADAESPLAGQISGLFDSEGNIIVPDGWSDDNTPSLLPDDEFLEFEDEFVESAAAFVEQTGNNWDNGIGHSQPAAPRDLHSDEPSLPSNVPSNNR